MHNSFIVSARGCSEPAAAAPFDLRCFRHQRLWSIRTWLIIFTPRRLARAQNRHWSDAPSDYGASHH